MCIDDRKRRREVYRKMRVESDRVDVEERNQRSACMIRQLDEQLGFYGCGSDDESVRS